MTPGDETDIPRDPHGDDTGKLLPRERPGPTKSEKELRENVEVNDYTNDDMRKRIGGELSGPS